MRKKQRRALEAYVRECADLMGLRDWRIDIGDGQPEVDGMGDDELGAAIDCRPGRKQAIITFSDAFFDCDRREQREHVAHELVHCHMALWWLQMFDLESQLSQPAYTVFLDSARRNMEVGVDGVSLVIAPTLPLPPVL